MVEFKGRFDESVAKNINNRSFKKLWWVFLICSVISIGLGVLNAVYPEDKSDFYLGIFLIVMGVLFAPLVFLITKILQKRVNNTMAVMSPDTTETYQFFPDKLTIIQQKQKIGEEVEYEAIVNTRYSYLYQVEETRDRYFLRISKLQSHVVNKSDITQGTIEELNEILSSNLGSRFKQMK